MTNAVAQRRPCNGIDNIGAHPCGRLLKNMKKLNFIWRLIGHNKYWIVIIIGVAIVGFIDDNSFMKRAEYEMEIRDLKEQISEYRESYEHDEALLKELHRNPGAVSRIAREKYFMKMEDEDVFVIREE